MLKALILLTLLGYIRCEDNFTMEDSALFYKTENEDGQRDPETDKSVQTILSWLQKRYKNLGQRPTRTNENQYDQHEYDSATMEPRPFGFSDNAVINNELLSETSVTSTEPTTVSNEIFPPAIRSLNVECQKDRMTVDIEFNAEFNGIIYSKDHYTNPECRYVTSDSHSARYRFTVQLNSCGTQFVNGYVEKGGQSYLENVIVVQNEPGILEIWDSIRSVRCQWEGSIRQSVTSGLSVVTPSTELVTFSGDTATARLEIQTGKGPFSTPDQKPTMIGDMMTLVISVDGDPEHMIRVGRCTAAGGGQEMQLSDDAGCPVRPKLMTGFEYTRNPETNGAMAYSFFRAFKFPDSNELNFDCNVELCKTPCVPCQDQNTGFHRKRRSPANVTDNFENNDILRIQNKLWISAPTQHPTSPDICMTSETFYITTFFIISVLLASLSATFHLYVTSKRLKVQI